MSSKLKLKAVVPAAMMAAAVANTDTASAADLLMDPPPPPEIITVATTGWYLRGDIGYNFNTIGKPEYNAPWGGTIPMVTGHLDDGWQIGLGVGYQIDEIFRVDLTTDYIGETKFLGSTAGFCDALAVPAGVPNCSSTEATMYSGWKFLGNAYADLGTYGGFTPYVGAGIGGAHITWKDLNSRTTCDGTVFACPPSFPNVNGGTIGYSQKGSTSWRFAWALHTGFSYDLAHATKLDIGYSFNRIEGGPMWQWANIGGDQGYDKGIDSHTIRAGLRYQIW